MLSLVVWVVAMDGSTCMDSSGESDSSGLDKAHFDPQVRGYCPISGLVRKSLLARVLDTINTCTITASALVA